MNIKLFFGFPYKCVCVCVCARTHKQKNVDQKYSLWKKPQRKLIYLENVLIKNLIFIEQELSVNMVSNPIKFSIN